MQTVPQGHPAVGGHVPKPRPTPRAKAIAIQGRSRRAATLEPLGPGRRTPEPMGEGESTPLDVPRAGRLRGNPPEPPLHPRRGRLGRPQAVNSRP